MSTPNPAIYGVSVSATHIAAVSLSAQDYALQGFVRRLMPQNTLSPDGMTILNLQALEDLLGDVMKELGHPIFEAPIYLTMLPAYLCTHDFDRQQDHNFPADLHHVATQTNPTLPSDNEMVILCTETASNASFSKLTFGALPTALIGQYIDLFYKFGYRLSGIDILPFSVLRTMAATGVLDSLLARYGYTLPWANFGISGSYTWLSFWEGNRLIYATSFITPVNSEGLEVALTQPLQDAQLALQAPKIWFAWQEAGLITDMDIMHLRLGAPIREAQTGPFYQQKTFRSPSLAALGTALYSEIPFPLGWDFLTQPQTQAFEAETQTVPYTNYQPKLPRILLVLFLAAFMLLSCLTLVLGLYVKHQADRVAAIQSQSELQLKHHANQEKRFKQCLTMLHDYARPGIQLQNFKISTDGHLTMTGLAFDMTEIQKYRSILTQGLHQPPQVKLNKVNITALNPPDNQHPQFQFYFDGVFLAFEPGGKNL